MEQSVWQPVNLICIKIFSRSGVFVRDLFGRGSTLGSPVVMGHDLTQVRASLRSMDWFGRTEYN